MAGAGFRTFVDGDILTAAQVNTYLMQQAVMVFADSAARSTALPSPTEGMVSYLVDTNAVEKYDGAAWVGLITLDLDDLTDVNAPTPGDGQVLTWQTSTSTWIPTTIAAVDPVPLILALS